MLSRRVFRFQKNFRGVLGVFSVFKSIFTASPKRFRASKMFLRLARRIFGAQKYFCGSPDAFLGFKRTFVASLGAFLAFKSIFTASPARFRALKVFLRLVRSVFGSQKHFCGLPLRFSCKSKQNPRQSSRDSVISTETIYMTFYDDGTGEMSSSDSDSVTVFPYTGDTKKDGSVTR